METFTASSYLLVPACFSSIKLKRTTRGRPVSAIFTRKKPPLPSPDQLLLSTSSLPASAPQNRTDPDSDAMALSNTFKATINKFFNSCKPHPSQHSARDALLGNFAPVDELSPTGCPVIHGSIPPCLTGGAYIRNGPNPQFLSSGPHHLYDGDGMLHSLLFSKDGSATLCSRYVKTYRYCLERDAGAPVMIKVFSDFHGFAGVASRVAMMARVLMGRIDITKGFGMANTNLAFFGGCLYALGEPDLPYSVVVDPSTGEISTIGRTDFGGTLVMGMTAHPKKDHVRGEMFAFRCSLVAPFLTYFHFDPAGNKLADVPIFSIQQRSFIHDFAITKNYVVFNDLQLEMNLMAALTGTSVPVGFNGGKVPRLGMLPRYATDDSKIRWFDVPGFNMTHSLNAWEEESPKGEKFLVLVAPNVLGIEHALEQLQHVHSCVEMVRINLDTGAVSRKPLSVGNLDLGVINSRYVGRKNQYAYLAVGRPFPNITGVVKLDFTLAGTRDCIIASRDFGPRCFGGEPFFVPNDDGTEEDDGYLLSYVHNEDTGESRLVVMDASAPKLDIVAEVVLPHRVPYGFHGLFVSEADLLSQRYLFGKF